MLCSTA